MQALAAEMNYSETTSFCRRTIRRTTRAFVTSTAPPRCRSPVTSNVGTACVLARHGRDRNGVLRFEQMAGLVEIAVERMEPAR